MQVVVEDETDGETLVTFSSVQLHLVLFSCMQFHLVACSFIELHVVPFSSVQFIQLMTYLEAVKLSELMEGAYLLCGR